MTLILGTKSFHHDQCFALLRDGVPVFVYELERFNRIKNGNSCDFDALFNGLRREGIRPSDIDLVTSCVDTQLTETKIRQLYDFLGPERRDQAAAAAPVIRAEFSMYSRLLAIHGFATDRILELRHHLTHCAAVYYPSACIDGAILSADGGGETEATVLAHGHGTSIDILESIPWPHSLGAFYQAATSWLGWGFGEEGKTMALAAYGRPRHAERLLDEFISVDEHGHYRYRMPMRSGEAFLRLFGPARSAGEPLDDHHRDVAASTQYVLEYIMVRLAKRARLLTRSKVLFVTGGVGLNSVCNGRIMRENIFDEVIAVPQANDTGNAIGGALYAHFNDNRVRGTNRWVMHHAYLGAELDSETTEQIAQEYNLTYSISEDVTEAAADLLADGKIVGWAQGRSEIGPRALGNRSILADPLAPGIKDRINAKVKNREEWRPFAPSVLAEDCGLFFETTQKLPYMIITADIKPEWREQLASIGHVDGTARVQTVDAAHNSKFHALISAFKRRAGIGMLLNTSMNGNGEPLIQTARQAIEFFLRSDMDALVLGDIVFSDKSGALAPPHFHPANQNVQTFKSDGRILVYTREKAQAFEPVLEAIVRNRIELSMVTDQVDDASQTLQRIANRNRNHATINLTPIDAFDLGRSAAFTSVAMLIPSEAFRFAIDQDLRTSDYWEISTRLRDLGCDVYWVDLQGSIVAMNMLLAAPKQ